MMRNGGSETVRAFDLVVAQALLCAIVLFLLSLYFGALQDWGHVKIGQLSFFISLPVLFFVVRLTPRNYWSASSVYLSVFFVFHFGLAIVTAFHLSINIETATYMLNWFYTPSTKAALALSCIGFVSCALGIHVGYISLSGENRNVQSTFRLRWLPQASFALLCLSVMAWFVIVVRIGGFGLLTASYGIFLEMTEGTPLPWVYYGIAVGAVLLASSPGSRLMYPGIAVFVIFALFALPLGLRGEVFFPTVSAFMVAVKGESRISVWKTLVLGVLLLGLIAILRDLRQTGLRSVDLSGIGGNPVAALTELGGSLRPVSETVLWRSMGDEFLYGGSYWAPIDRVFLYHTVPGWTRPVDENDLRLMNVIVKERVGAIGFSPVAEAYRNFGKPGVIAIMGIIGFLLGRMDSWQPTRIRMAVLGVVFLSILMNVRNDFTPVPAQIAFGLALILSLELGERMLSSSIRNSSRGESLLP